MRITFKQVNRHMQSVIGDRYGDLAKLHERIATGKRLLRPSDDPVDVANALKLREKLAQFKQYNRNIKDGQAFMSVADTAMLSMNELMQRVRELAIRAASDSMGATERDYIQKEVEQLTRQVISLANTQYKGDYVFAGTQTKITPFPIAHSSASTVDDYTNFAMAGFDTTAGLDTPIQIRDVADDGSENPLLVNPIKNIIPGTFTLSSTNSAVHGVGTRHTWVEGQDYTIDYVNGTITVLSTGSDPAALQQDLENPANYNANNFRMEFEHISQGKNIYGDSVTLDGNVLREIETGIVMPINVSGEELMRDNATGVHLLEMLLRFNEDLIEDNRVGVQSAITKIDSAFKNLLEAQSKNGARLNRFDTTLERNERQFTETTRLSSEMEDADFAETVAQFSLAETVYNAALNSAAKVLQPSLANFL